MLTGATTDYYHPDAPTRYRSADGSFAKRQCDKCKEKVVNTYTEPYTYQKPTRIVLLCGPCDYARRSTNLEPLEFVGRAKTKNPKKRRYTAKLGNTGGIMLPGLANARIQAGVDRDLLSRKAGCSMGHLYDVESGRKRASRELARRLARQLGVTIEELKEEMSAELAS